MNRLRPATDSAPPPFRGKGTAATTSGLRDRGRQPFVQPAEQSPSTSQGSAQRSPSSENDLLRATALAEAAQLASLVAACLRGDTHAWEMLVRSQQRRVYGLCYRFTGSAVEAEDMTQEVFLKVYRNLGSFDPAKATLGVWLTALTRNLLVDHYRRTRTDRVTDSLDEPASAKDDSPTGADRLTDPRPTQEKHVAGVELRARVQAALAKVSPDLREAVILRDLQDMDYADIAAILCIPQGTVKSRISRGRAELARLLKSIEGQVI